MDKVTIPISKEDVLRGLAQLPKDELASIIEELEDLLASRGINPQYDEIEGMHRVKAAPDLPSDGASLPDQSS